MDILLRLGTLVIGDDLHSFSERKRRTAGEKVMIYPRDSLWRSLALNFISGHDVFVTV